MDLGPQDHGWCAGYSCQRRLSLFHSIVALNKSYEVYFTGTSPQNLRLVLLNVKHDKVRQDGNNWLKVIGINYLLIFLSAKDFISSPVLWTSSAIAPFQGSSGYYQEYCYPRWFSSAWEHIWIPNTSPQYALESYMRHDTVAYDLGD